MSITSVELATLAVEVTQQRHGDIAASIFDALLLLNHATFQQISDVLLDNASKLLARPLRILPSITVVDLKPKIHSSLTQLIQAGIVVANKSPKRPDQYSAFFGQALQPILYPIMLELISRRHGAIAELICAILMQVMGAGLVEILNEVRSLAQVSSTIHPNDSVLNQNKLNEDIKSLVEQLTQDGILQKCAGESGDNGAIFTLCIPRLLILLRDSMLSSFLGEGRPPAEREALRLLHQILIEPEGNSGLTLSESGFTILSGRGRIWETDDLRRAFINEWQSNTNANSEVCGKAVKRQRDSNKPSDTVSTSLFDEVLWILQQQHVTGRTMLRRVKLDGVLSKTRVRFEHDVAVRALMRSICVLHIRSRFGASGGRVFNLLLRHGAMEESALHDEALLSHEATRQVLAAMQCDGFVYVTEVPWKPTKITGISGERNTTNTMFLWTTDLARVATITREQTAKMLRNTRSLLCKPRETGDLSGSPQN